MASITIQKHTSGSTKAQGRHNFRENKNNANRNIDPTKTHLNLNLDERFKDSSEMQAAIRERVKEVDKVLPPQRKKKDRVVSVCIEVPAPRPNMTYEDSVKFLKAANEAINQKFGMENCLGAMIHADEQHNYIDPKDRQVKESRIHLHKMVVPYVEGKGVNGKQFVPKSLYRELNKLLDEVCMKELGYPFQDGTKQKSRGRVEDLKADTAIATSKIKKNLEKKVDELTQKNEKLEATNQELKEQSKELSIGLDEGMKELESLEQKIFDKKDIIKEAQEMEALLEIASTHQPKEYKKNLTGKYVQVPVEDLDEIARIPQYARASLEHLSEARKTIKEATKMKEQAISDMARAKSLENAHKGYDAKLNDLEKEIAQEADRRAVKKVYEVLGDKVSQDRQLDAFFKEKGLWLSFQKFCTDLVRKAPRTQTFRNSHDYDDDRDR